MSFREQAALHAADLIGTPFYHQGRNPSLEGLDCVGLVLEAYRRAGIDLPDRSGYPRHGNAAWLEELVASACDPIEQPEPGAILLLSHRGSSRSRHIALASGPEHMIHARHGQVVKEDRIVSRSRIRKLTLLSSWRVKEAD